MGEIRITNIKVYAMKDEVAVIERNGVLIDRVVKKPMIVLNQEVNFTIDKKQLNSERNQWKKSDTDIVHFTYENL
jgi:hypothetical protein